MRNVDAHGGPRRALAWTAALALALSAAAAAPAQDAGPFMGVQAIEEPLMWFVGETAVALPGLPDYQVDPGAVTTTGRPPMDYPVAVMLSRHRYPAEEGHLDVIVRFDMDLGQRPEGRLAVALFDADGNALSQGAVEPIPGSQLFFSYRLLEGLAGSGGELQLAWQREGAPDAEATAEFRVAPPEGAARSGRVRIRVPNDSGAAVRGAPVTVGVPFPRGALDDAEHVRLVGADGEERPLQVQETSRWSRYGSVRWLLCDFTADLDGGAKEFWLEYGPDVRRAPRQAIAVEARPEGGFPDVEAGRLRIDGDGIWWDGGGAGNFRKVLERAALTGAFVEHTRGIETTYQAMSSGTIYNMPGDAEFHVEEVGPEKAVLRAEGWYEHAGTGGRFCKFVTRYVLHRDSPVVRIFHTWIFTGDGNRDTVRDFGWRFPVAGMSPVGFLSEFGEGAQWMEGYYLRQHDADEWEAFTFDRGQVHARAPDYMKHHRQLRHTRTGRRSPGVAAADTGGVRVMLGVQDFWQNFPRSLRIEDGALTFYEWPRYGRAPQPEHRLGAGDWSEAWRLWFAHEGNVLSFRLPLEYTMEPIHFAASGPEPHVDYGRPDSVNAQGVAKTAEMWLRFAEPGREAPEDAAVMQGLAEETLRGVVDPKWMAASGAFYEIGAADEEAYPAYAQAYAEHATHLVRQAERMRTYGKWLYGEMLSGPNLDEQRGGLYRFLRKAHHGWPYSWLPFVATGRADLMRMAQAATRMMSDVAFCHYVGEDVAQQFADMPVRQMWGQVSVHPRREIGWHNRNMIPWAGYFGPTSRMYVDQQDYLWHAWYVTGYGRARDVALAWAEQTKVEHPHWGRGPVRSNRWLSNLQKQYLEMYEAIFDPWFLAAAHAIADLRLWEYRQGGWTPWRTHEATWGGGLEAYQRYSGCPKHEELIMHYAGHWADWHRQGWHGANSLVRPLAYAYRLTGDEFYLRRAAGLLDMATWGVYLGDEPDYWKGGFLPMWGAPRSIFDSWMQSLTPLVFGMFDRAGGAPERPIPHAFSAAVPETARIAIRKEAGQELTLRTGGRFRIAGPDGETQIEGEENEVVLPAEWPAGTYWLDPGGRAMTIPVSPPDTPEVLVDVGGGGLRAAGSQRAQFWFYVPEGAESFWLEFTNIPHFRQELRQNMVWNPEGHPVWAHRQHSADHDPDTAAIRAEIIVPPEHAGRLWRVTKPGYWSAGRADSVRFDPQIPPVLAHCPARWFDPRNVPSLGE